jgi:hypothetical protein
LEEKLVMPIKRYKAEQIVTMLRQIEVSIANGKTTPQACKEAEIIMHHGEGDELAISSLTIGVLTP